MTFSVTKDPDATLDYLVDWEPFLAGDFIDSVAWIVPAGLTNIADTNTTTTATVWLSGGSAGVRYPVVCRITTVGGRTDDRTLAVAVLNK